MSGHIGDPNKFIVDGLQEFHLPAISPFLSPVSAITTSVTPACFWIEQNSPLPSQTLTGGVGGVMVCGAENGIGDPRSNPGRSICIHVVLTLKGKVWMCLFIQLGAKIIYEINSRQIV